MRWWLVGLIALCVASGAEAAKLKPADLYSTESILRWINAYRSKPDPESVPAVMVAASKLGALGDPERAGVYVGFFAGVLATNGDRAATLIDQALPMREEDRWMVVRAIAYSGLPHWKYLLQHYAERIPKRRAMIERYIGEQSPRLDQLAINPSPSQMQKLGEYLRIGKRDKKIELEPNADVLDTLWGYYFATGSYGPVMRIIALLEWSEDHDDVERLVLGSMAKYTLATNAVRDEHLLGMIKSSARARNQPKATIAALKDVADASESVDTGRIRKQALAAVDELRRKGPASRRQTQWWTFVGSSVIAGGCLAAAMTGHVELGLPCVIGGAASSAVMNAWANAP